MNILVAYLKNIYKVRLLRREAKSKGEMKRYTLLNAKFQRIAWRDKKIFLKEQCKEVEENNREAE